MLLKSGGWRIIQFNPSQRRLPKTVSSWVLDIFKDGDSKPLWAPAFDTLTVKKVFPYVEVECPVLQSLILSDLPIQRLSYHAWSNLDLPSILRSDSQVSLKSSREKGCHSSSSNTAGLTWCSSQGTTTALPKTLSNHPKIPHKDRPSGSTKPGYS